MNVTTFGSSRIGSDEKEFEEGIRIGKFFAKEGFTVRCGGYGGLMEAVSRGVYEEGGRCIGYGLEFFDAIRPKNPYISELIVCKNLHERIERLIEDCSLFVVQKGEIGTLNELFFVWCLKYAKINSDFRICLVGREWEELFKLNFISRDNYNMLEFYENADDLIGRVLGE